MSPTNPFPVSLSIIDEKRFGFRTARASQVTRDNLPLILDFCRANQVVFLIARCSTDETHAAQDMERNGFLLMDTLVYYKRSLTDPPIPPDDGSLIVRSFRKGEEDIIRKISERAFTGYRGHYHSDEKLPQNLCDETYADWAYQSCTTNLAEEVLVAEHNGEIKGFLTLRLSNQDTGEGVLFGVSPDAQGTGVGRSLMIGAMHWFRNKGAANMIISTQIINLSSQKVWARLGFELSFAKYTFHKWFDKE